MTQEEQIATIETQLNEINQVFLFKQKNKNCIFKIKQAEMKINELDIDQKNEYESLMDENKKLLLQMNVLRNELEQVNIAYLQSENKLRVIISFLRNVSFFFSDGYKQT